MKQAFLVILMLTFFTTSAFAGIVIDPYFGSSSATAVVDGIPAGYDNEGSATGTTFGSRVGLSFSMLSAGIDYGIYSTDKTESTDMSAFVGIDLPFLFRFWAEYYISSSGNSIYLDQYGEGSDLVFKDGYSVGIGFTGLPLVSVNFEAITKNYVVEDVPFLGDLDVAYADYVISLSLPLDL